MLEVGLVDVSLDVVSVCGNQVMVVLDLLLKINSTLELKGRGPSKATSRRRHL